MDKFEQHLKDEIDKLWGKWDGEPPSCTGYPPTISQIEYLKKMLATYRQLMKPESVQE